MDSLTRRQLVVDRDYWLPPLWNKTPIEHTRVLEEGLPAQPHPAHTHTVLVHWSRSRLNIIALGWPADRISLTACCTKLMETCSKLVYMFPLCAFQTGLRVQPDSWLSDLAGHRSVPQCSNLTGRYCPCLLSLVDSDCSLRAGCFRLLKDWLGVKNTRGKHCSAYSAALSWNNLHLDFRNSERVNERLEFWLFSDCVCHAFRYNSDTVDLHVIDQVHLHFI